MSHDCTYACIFSCKFFLLRLLRLCVVIFAVVGKRISLNNQLSLHLLLHIPEIVKESLLHEPQILHRVYLLHFLHLQLSLDPSYAGPRSVPDRCIIKQTVPWMSPRNLSSIVVLFLCEYSSWRRRHRPHTHESGWSSARTWSCKSAYGSSVSGLFMDFSRPIIVELLSGRPALLWT